MASQYGLIQVKRSRGKLQVQGIGRTPKGAKFIKKSEGLVVKDIGDKDFKAELATAVGKLYVEEGSG